MKNNSSALLRKISEAAGIMALILAVILMVLLCSHISFGIKDVIMVFIIALTAFLAVCRPAGKKTARR